MARVKGKAQIAVNYEVGLQRPFDARQLVTKISDLTTEATWTKYTAVDGSTYNNAYKGMIVACAEDAGIYVLKDLTQITSLENGWIKVGENGGTAGSAEQVVFVNSVAELPNIGEKSVLYLDLSKLEFRYWDSDNLMYRRISSDWQDIEKIDGGHAVFTKEKYTNDYIPGQS